MVQLTTYHDPGGHDPEGQEPGASGRRGQRTPELRTYLPGGMLRQYSRDLARLQQLLDPLGVVALLWVLARELQQPLRQQEWWLAAGAAALILLAAPQLGLYSSFRERSHWSLLRRVALLWGLLVGGTSLALFSFKVGAWFSRELLLLWFVSSGLWLSGLHVGSRQLLRQLRIHGFNSRWDGYVGTVEGFERLRRQIHGSGWLGHTLQPLLLWPREQGPDPALLRDFALRLRSDLPDQWLLEDCSDPDLLNRLLELLEGQTAPVLLLPRWLEQGRYRPQYMELGPVAALQLWGSEATPLQLVLKQICDRLASALLLLALAPLLLLIALIIRLDTAGPVLFRQRRYGLEGHSFSCLKFRTMLVQENGTRVEQARRHDPRITRSGRLLRAWNLDELPQLWNVCCGEMSLVGPRPHAAAHNEFYRTRVRGYMRRHALRPGLTGWAQVQGLRGETETLSQMAARVEADLDYIQNWSLRLDLKILLLTLLRWRSERAY